MAVKYSALALIFRKEDRHEADRIFSVFARDFGRVQLHAKAVRRIDSKLKGGLELFSISQLEFIQGKNRKTLTDAITVEKFKNITRDPEKFQVATAISEALGGFVKDPQIDQVLWDLVTDIFTRLDLDNQNDKFLYYYFFWNFISLLGYQPHLAGCVVCREALDPGAMYFSNEDGGLLCQPCTGNATRAKKIHADVVKIIRLILQKDLAVLYKLKIPVASKKQLREISDDYRNYLAHMIS